MNTLALSTRLVASLARVGIASVQVTGPDAVKDRLSLAMGGELGEVEAEHLAVELDALAELLAPGALNAGVERGDVLRRVTVPDDAPHDPRVLGVDDAEFLAERDAGHVGRVGRDDVWQLRRNSHVPHHPTAPG
jgi:hypothetical protein